MSDEHACFILPSYNKILHDVLCKMNIPDLFNPPTVKIFQSMYYVR